ncbi:SpoIIE family protein phosphatase [Granulicella tundricola]|uniref:Protein serine/threonine phosphatase with extracellular sensor n=1 Tax=Granulicella tundricola (strain ATCC BAA-1859 / DSM 23138 / MP5ACTX9) TaxID=1198114 RepID=E8X0G9_GRATM|nr:SpoIIE family protein phosphatase [Granulicella tundricola]ADW67833.1 protein serine/threonine phosphatase with extracellular sensor [Granulicella tundricola MP5ACTX9]
MNPLSQRLRNAESSVFAAVARRPPSGFIEHATIRLVFVSFIAFASATFVPGTIGKLFWILAFTAMSVLTLFLMILIWRWIMGHILWKVRNRLIVTCLLLALAPILLFGTLISIASYVFAGQFGTSAAMTGIDEDLALASHRSDAIAHLPLSILTNETNFGRAGEHNVAHVWEDGTLHTLTPHAASTQPPASAPASPFATPAPPAWLHPGFSGLVAADGKLYLCAAGGAQTDSHSILVLESTPFGEEQVTTFATGLGSLNISPGIGVHTSLGANYTEDDKKKIDDEDDHAQFAVGKETGKGEMKDDDGNVVVIAKADGNAVKPVFTIGKPGTPKTPHLHKHKTDSDLDDEFNSFTSLHGGTLPPAHNSFDWPVFASSPLQVYSWKTGEKVGAWMMIQSRPSLLYKRLFSNSLEVGSFIRIALAVTAATFGILELLALLLAIGLIRTITASVADLYFATRQIETGNLLHRIRVKRRDQLAALATSFNTMSGSLAELMVQQREKDRMQNELNIAHEVQNNLFPHTPIGLPGLELYGICNPARTIGGDYYDFIPMGTAQVYLALGDISGKGISAALLMSSLYSAVRVYLQGGNKKSITAITPNAAPALAEPLPSPGKLLSLLNQHLYSSTQPEKYATLFLASYDSATRRLTYSNGGHLPPLVLCSDGKVTRLEAGGSVVGLLGGMEYKEATVQLNPGDLLIAYSDGLTEPEQDGIEFGEDRLIEVIRKNRHRPLPAIANYTVQCLKDWMGDGEQPDDITIVFARLT